MKSHTEYLTFNTSKRVEIVNITNKLEEILEKSKIQEGFMLVAAMHITASVFINDNESGLHEDIKDWLQKLAPFGPDYQHHRTGEDNGDSHLKNLLIGHQVLIPITKGAFDFGPWQEVFYGEWDGKRSKRVIVKVIGE